MSDAKAVCKVCGEPMPAGEEMFTCHGYSGPCPKPLLPRPRMLSAIRYFSHETGGKFWLDVEVDGNAHDSIGFDTEQERATAYGDLMLMMRASGATEGKLQ